MTEEQTNDNGQEQQAGNEAQVPDFSIPEEYKEKGWTQNVKSVDDLWKATDNAQSLVGKRAEDYIKENNYVQRPEQDNIMDFLADFKPEDATSYDLKGLFDNMPDDNVEYFQNAFAGANLAVPQAKAVMEAWSKFSEEKTAELTDENTYKTMLSETLGSNYESIKLDNDKMLKTILSPEEIKAFELAPNATKVMHQKILKSLSDKYGYVEGDLGASKPTGMKSMDDMKTRHQELTKELQALATGKMYTQAQKDAILKEREELTRQIYK